MRTPTPWILPTLPTTRDDLVARGVSPGMLRSRVAAGDLLLVRRGVYVRADAYPDDDAGRHLLLAHAELAVHPEGAISHASAALTWGLPTPGFARWQDSPATITLPPGRTVRPTHAVHHTGPLPPSQVERDEQGNLVTSPARTAVDLASDLPLPESLVLLDGAARLVIASLLGRRPHRQEYTNPRLVDAAVARLSEAAATTRAARLRPAIALVVPSRESVAESLTAGHLQLAGLPTPEFQTGLRTPGGIVYPDFYWRGSGLIGEVDGAVKYTDAGAYVLEKEREQMLRDLGYAIVRWLAKEIMLYPARVTGRIARALGY